MTNQLLLPLIACLVAWSCEFRHARAEVFAEGGNEMTLKLESPAFEDTKRIPEEYTCDGKDVSPPLKWTGVPRGTAGFVLIVDDPDAPVGTWVHWVLFNIPAGVTELAKALPKDPSLPDGTRQGKNSWGRSGYGGPCPPSGTHRYFFKLYALDSPLELAAGATKQELLQAMEGKILEQAQYMGLYSR